MKSKSGLYFTPFLLVIQLTGCRDQRDISRPLSVVAHKQNEKVEPAQRTEKSVTRREFAKQMAKVKRGMSETEVLALLGEPDDRLIGREQTRVAIALGKQIWCYGTNGHFTFPTLGWIYFDADGKADPVLDAVRHVIGMQQLRP